MTSPYAFYQYFLNVEDVGRGVLKALTDRGRAEIEELNGRSKRSRSCRQAQRTLAADVDHLVHGPGATDAVQAASEALFGKGGRTCRRGHPPRRDERAARCRRRGGHLRYRCHGRPRLVESRKAAGEPSGRAGVSLNNVKVTDGARPRRGRLPARRVAVLSRAEVWRGCRRRGWITLGGRYRVLVRRDAPTSSLRKSDREVGHPLLRVRLSWLGNSQQQPG